jgi:hypothetical protein
LTDVSERRIFILLPLLILSALVVGLTPGRSSAATQINVPGDFPTIQAALNAAAPGDTVRVAPGTYAEALEFGGKDVRLESTDGAGVTTLDVPGTTGVQIGPGGAFIGFTVTGAQASFGAGMDVSGIGTLVKGNIFDGNAQSAGGYGAGIGGNSASPIVDGNVFRNNTCDMQFLSGVVAFVNGSSPRIVNNLFLHNGCRAINMTLPEGNHPEVINNTIVDNPVGIRVDARIPTGAQAYRNNVIVGNNVGLHVEFGSAARNPTWQNNLVFGNSTNYSGIADHTGLAGNISADPLFAAAAQDDYRPKAGSPAIDTGSTQAAPATDFAGTTRPLDGDGNGSADFDIGAFEFQQPAPTVVGIDIKPKNKNTTISLRLDKTVKVAVLSAAGFDATTAVVRTSLTFGRTGYEQSRTGCDAKGTDVNGDRRKDLVCTFSVPATGFQVDDIEGILRGQKVGGAPIEGRDTVRIVA